MLSRSSGETFARKSRRRWMVWETGSSYTNCQVRRLQQRCGSDRICRSLLRHHESSTCLLVRMQCQLRADRQMSLLRTKRAIFTAWSTGFRFYCHASFIAQKNDSSIPALNKHLTDGETCIRLGFFFDGWYSWVIVLYNGELGFILARHLEVVLDV